MLGVENVMLDCLVERRLCDCKLSIFERQGLFSCQISVFTVYQDVKFRYLIWAVFNTDRRNFIKINKKRKSDINQMTFFFLIHSFNQLDLPAYETYDKLRSMLNKAVDECPEGFGLAWNYDHKIYTRGSRTQNDETLKRQQHENEPKTLNYCLLLGQEVSTVRQ